MLPFFTSDTKLDCFCLRSFFSNVNVSVWIQCKIYIRGITSHVQVNLILGIYLNLSLFLFVHVKNITFEIHP